MIELFEHYFAGYPSQTEIHHGADPNEQRKYPGNEKLDKQYILKSIMDYEKK